MEIYVVVCSSGSVCISVDLRPPRSILGCSHAVAVSIVARVGNLCQVAMNALSGVSDYQDHSVPYSYFAERRDVETLWN